jgi:hypothetical protein
MFNRHMIEHVCFKQRVLLGRRIGIVSYLIFNVKHCKERKKQKDLYSCQHALVTTVNLQFQKAKQLTVSNAFPAQDIIFQRRK